MLWTGRVLSAIPVLFMFFLPIYFLAAKQDMMREGMKKYGYPEHAFYGIVIAEMACAAIYMIPQTSVLGAILLTGYLGGATATHVHAGEPFIFPVAMGVVIWLGIYLRDARVRALVPLRS